MTIRDPQSSSSSSSSSVENLRPLAARVHACKASYGGRPWSAIDEAGRTVWLETGVTRIQTLDGPVHTDGLARFFVRKRDLLAAIARTPHVQLIAGKP